MRKQTKNKNLAELIKEKKLGIPILILIACSIIITIGCLTEEPSKDEGTPNVPVAQQEEDKKIEEPKEPEEAPVVEKTEEPDEKTDEPEDNDDLDAEEEVILTIENSPTFAKVMASTEDNDPIFSRFASLNKDATIEFDAHIDDVTNHGDYKTRWDILLSGGDWVDGDTVSPGPIFKFENVNLNQLGIKDLFLPDFVSRGSNIHVVAKVWSYSEGAQIMFLKPIKITHRTI